MPSDQSCPLERVEGLIKALEKLAKSCPRCPTCGGQDDGHGQRHWSVLGIAGSRVPCCAPVACALQSTETSLMRGSVFDEISFFSAIESSRTRALLIGRRALVVLGLPVLTADYDFWLHADDIEKLNEAARPFELGPNRDPADARRLGRYVLENDEHIDVLVSVARTTVDGIEVRFDDLWSRRVSVEIGGAKIFIPTIDDLILTKRIAARPKDAEDIRLLERLKEARDD